MVSLVEIVNIVVFYFVLGFVKYFDYIWREKIIYEILFIFKIWKFLLNKKFFILVLVDFEVIFKFWFISIMI